MEQAQAQFKILECEETGSMKYHALRVSVETPHGGKTEVGIADCVVYEYFDTNSTHSHCEIVSVQPEELEETIKELEDEIIAAMG